MGQKIKPLSLSFTEIKKGLDPNFSYIIFEKDFRPGDEADFSEITGLLHQKEGVIDREIHLDHERQRLLLVARLDPEHAGNRLQELLAAPLPTDINISVYEKRPGH